LIEIAIWAAVGGRHAVGPILGAFVVNGAKSWFTQAVPNTGCLFGLLFILVTLFLPQGVIGLRGAGDERHSIAYRGQRVGRPSRRPACGSPAKASHDARSHPLSRRDHGRFDARP
jgi:hypothetical protein